MNYKIKCLFDYCATRVDVGMAITIYGIESILLNCDALCTLWILMDFERQHFNRRGISFKQTLIELRWSIYNCKCLWGNESNNHPTKIQMNPMKTFNVNWFDMLKCWPDLPLKHPNICNVWANKFSNWASFFHFVRMNFKIQMQSRCSKIIFYYLMAKGKKEMNFNLLVFEPVNDDDDDDDNCADLDSLFDSSFSSLWSKIMLLYPTIR